MHRGTVDLEELLAHVYPRLRAMAGNFLRQERSNHTLQPTALANETLIRFLGSREVFQLPAECFLRVAASQMRKVLIDYGRRNRAAKRDSGASPVIPGGIEISRSDSWLALDEALTRLGEFDPRALSAVELKFFGGHTTSETAAILGVSDATVESDWKFARTWLFDALTNERPTA